MSYSFKTLKGKEKKLVISKYLIDWDGDCRSIFQFNVKRFLYKYWKHNVVLEELPVAGTKMTLDIVNLTKGVAVEIQGTQHQKYNKFFHNNSDLNYLAQLKRDMDKNKWCTLNGFELVEIFPEDLDNLSTEWFSEKYSIDL